MNIAIVTGASSGMGREFVRQLHSYIRPDEIWAIARRKEALEALAAETTIPVRPIVLDLGKRESFQPVPYITTYGATKAFVLSYTRACNAELKPRGIRMMAMNPAWVKTEFFNHAFQTNNRVQYFNYVQEAKDVVAIGLKDLYKTRKDMSIPGLGVKLQVLGVKLLPHKLVMKTWMNQQKKPLNNQGLTK